VETRRKALRRLQRTRRFEHRHDAKLMTCARARPFGQTGCLLGFLWPDRATLGAVNFINLRHTVQEVVVNAGFLEHRLERVVERVRESRPIPLRFSLWNGRSLDLGHAPRVTVRVLGPGALRYLVSPDLMKLGQAYVEGHLQVEGRLADVVADVEAFARSAARRSKLAGVKSFVRHTRRRDREAIRYHYDVSNDFYRLFLDPQMVYSCAYFKSESDTLAQAQVHKIDHILHKLQLRRGERLLDIGCGWGALVIRAAQEYGAQAVGITLSENQYAWAQRRVKEEGLEGRVEIRLQDYRDVPETGSFDKIASVGMFEHVGLRNLRAYFGRIHEMLRDGGAVLNHGITAVDPESRSVGLGAGEFIGKYVFPHGELPHIALVLSRMAEAGLETVDVESLRRHYARTAGLWAESLERNHDEAIRIADEKRYRIWSIYLQGSSFGFREGWMHLHQVLAVKQGGPAMNTLPMTRDYMYAGGAA
jgi:cyclopropane-fatty-acyl-phospholipid synthase